MKLPMAVMPRTVGRNLQIANVTDGETIYQRCLLLVGQCDHQAEPEAHISVSTNDAFGVSSFPLQTWPVSDGQFKALVLLSPGLNRITLRHFVEGKVYQSLQLTLMYASLSQLPPLHLAIMIAKDSPLLIDCPPNKSAQRISSAHSDLNAAIAKFRMTAYMWQALTAEDMRSKGLGRRSFRLEEEWGIDTLSKDFVNAAHEYTLFSDTNSAVRSTAKINLIRSEKTVAQLRDAQLAQQNPTATNNQGLFNDFLSALKVHGGPFSSSARPVVAGLILDSHYSIQQDLILGHAALGCHNPNDISLGMFGSHLTYSWPRFLEEVPSSLLDSSPPGNSVGNDNGECGTIWEACSIGQGAFLHEVGHAFGAPHTSGIMARGYAQDWPKNFLSTTAYCAHTKADGSTVIDGETMNNARWDLRDALSFTQIQHFRLPSDSVMTRDIATAAPVVELCQEEGTIAYISITCPAGIVRVEFNGTTEPSPNLSKPSTFLKYGADELERRFGRDEELELSVLGMNGREKTVKNVWKVVASQPFIRIPGSDIVLKKRSVISEQLQNMDENEDEERNFWHWAVLFNKRGKKGMTRVRSFDMRIGLILDGGVLQYQDGSRENCGPAYKTEFGGHASKEIAIANNVDVTKMAVFQRDGELCGLTTYLSNGQSAGEADDYAGDCEVSMLEPGSDERIIGFFGRSDWHRGFEGIQEFGIIIAPKNVELPEAVYEMKELQNTDGSGA